MTKEQAEHSIKMGEKFPFDASDLWWGYDESDPSKTYPKAKPPVASDWAHAAARGIIANLKDRRGIKQSLEELPEDIRVEIVGSIAAIIRLAEYRAHE